MIFRNIKKEEFELAKKLYRDVIANSTTFGWDDNYPSDQMIADDIKDNNLFGLFDKDELVAVSYVGKRNIPDYIDFWKLDIKRPAKWTRICVSPKHQNKGIGTLFVEKIVKKLKAENYDGIRILVAKQNTSALKLYAKQNFDCVGNYFEGPVEMLCFEKYL